MDVNGKRIYISGPMTGIKDWNRQTFMEAAVYLRNNGAARVFNPAFNPIAEADTHSNYMTIDLHELTENMDGKPYYDVLAQLPGWEKSMGARVELVVAKACGIEVMTI